MKKILFSALLLVISGSVLAESRLPFMRDLAGDHELPKPWGISLDFYTMDQNYDLDFLQFELPGISLDDPSLLDVTNSVQHFDIKLDAWILPFLNVFGIIGALDADTLVGVTRAGLDIPVDALPVAYDGTVYGLGFTLAAGGENWFASLTTTATDTSLSGGFESDVSSLTEQLRIGLNRGDWQYFLGAMYLDTDESHKGTITIPFLGVDDDGIPDFSDAVVPFAVELSGSDKVNYAIGVHHQLSESFDLTFEIGFGDREHTLFNIGYRF